MSELFLIIKDFTISNPLLVTWTVAGFLVFLGVLLQYEWIKEWFSEFKLRRLLKSIGKDSLHNVTVPDGMDGRLFIENLILTADKIILLGVKKFRGVIFAAEKIDLWTQVIGNKSYKFENPLRQLENDALALSAKIENSKIEEKVLFIKGSEFPKGKPEKVVTIADLKKLRIDNVGQTVSESLAADWKILQEQVVDDVQEKGIMLKEDNSTGLNVFSLMTILIITSLWLIWRLM